MHVSRVSSGRGGKVSWGDVCNIVFLKLGGLLFYLSSECLK